MQPAHPKTDTEASALAAVYRLLRELGKRRLARRANVDEPVTALPRPTREMQDEAVPPHDRDESGTGGG